MNIAQYTRAELHTAPCPMEPPPNKTVKVWQPVKHSTFADLLCSGLSDAGYKITNEAWHLSQKNYQLTGVIELEPTPDFDWDTVCGGMVTYNNYKAQGISLRIVAKHANNLTLALHLEWFARVKICSNGMIVDSNNKILARKKTYKKLKFTIKYN